MFEFFFGIFISERSLSCTNTLRIDEIIIVLHSHDVNASALSSVLAVPRSRQHQMSPQLIFEVHTFAIQAPFYVQDSE